MDRSPVETREALVIGNPGPYDFSMPVVLPPRELIGGGQTGTFLERSCVFGDSREVERSRTSRNGGPAYVKLRP